MMDSSLGPLLDLGAELAALMVKSSAAPATLASEILHGKKRLDPDQKRTVALLAYGTLRHLGHLTAASGAMLGASPAEHARFLRGLGRLAPALACLIGLHLKVWDPLQELNLLSTSDQPEEEIQDELGRLCALADIDGMLHRLEDSMVPLPCRASMPAWLVEDLLHDARYSRSPEQVLRLGLALSRPAPLWLRIRRGSAAMERVREELLQKGFPSHPHPQIPDCLYVQGRPQLKDLPAYQDGLCEVQDAGSQFISHVLAPYPGWEVLDSCAGAGGKTLHLAELMDRQGQIVARDLSRVRLSSLPSRIRRWGYSCITVDTGMPPAHEHFDAVLVDAPCSGLGTARRTPTIPWRATRKGVERLHTTQLGILLDAADRTAPGGVLVYATCSTHPLENEHVVDAFLSQRSDYSTSPLPPISRDSEQSPGHPQGENWRRPVHPLDFDGDGYFVARMKRS